DPGPVRKVSQRTCDRAPTAADTGLGDASFSAIRRLLIDHQIERHEAGKKIGELSVDMVARADHPRRQLHPQAPIDTRRRERGVFDCLYKHAALLRPLLDALVEE